MIRESNKLFLALIITDVGFIFLHILFVIGRLSSASYSIFEDFGYSEIYQYLKEFWIFVLLVFLAISRRKFIYLSWGLLFSFFLFDDSLRIHERLGLKISELWNFKSIIGLDPHDIGEIVVMGMVGLSIFLLIGLTYFKSEDFEKIMSKKLFILVILLCVFGIVFDALHEMISFGSNIFGFIEDGGEIIVMSLILSYVYSIPLLEKTKKKSIRY